MNKLIAAPALAAVLTAGVGLGASAQSTIAFTTTPVEVVHYTARAPYSYPEPFSSGSFMNVDGSSSVTVSFVNKYNVAATKIQFSVRTRKGAEIVTDNGTFSQGAKIEHRFDIDPQLGEARNVEVQSATFADGTVWQR